MAFLYEFVWICFHFTIVSAIYFLWSDVRGGIIFNGHVFYLHRILSASYFLHILALKGTILFLNFGHLHFDKFLCILDRIFCALPNFSCAISIGNWSHENRLFFNFFLNWPISLSHETIKFFAGSNFKRVKRYERIRNKSPCLFLSHNISANEHHNGKGMNFINALHERLKVK